MSNWQTVTLEDVAESINTGLDAIRRAPIVEHQTNLRCLRIQDISQDKPFNEWGFTETKKSDYEKYKLTSGDIIIARTGGSIGVNKLIRNDLESVFNNGLARIRVNKNFATPEFIYCVMQSINFKSHINAISSGTAAQPNMKVGDMAKFEFKLPPLNEQKKITETIFAFIDKIQLNTQINQTLEQIAQALFKSWFVDFDPVRAKVQALSDGMSLEQAELAAMQAISGKTPEELTALSQTQPNRYAELAETAKAFPCEMVEVDGGEMPKGWEVTPLSGLFTLISGTQIPKEEHIYEAKEGYERFIQNRDYSSNNHITYVEISKKNKRCTEKDILIDRYGDAGKIRFGISGVYNIALAKIVLNDNNLTEYLRWFLMQPKQKAYFEQASGASTRASLNTSTFKGINVVIPSNFILNIFSKISNTYLDSLRNLKEENNTLMKTRDSLLPKLLKQDV
ncbi:restriction endonuclease subunit S [uncultured Aggregatibacter sp.]|uniref:restriction endonuclease subunit S n=1 Tax=uncultured Aggregatibacter sp. TaxID=470564 RepID=UPI001A5485BA|nr:restriction endonuclease subunit S [uncultured Aggregatibacter sp.]VTX82900.1 Type-1 restriction enzyme EcoKI specificity protein [uncultured Aggregatibacter sp.]